jgi:hypothetical protein
MREKDFVTMVSLYVVLTILAAFAVGVKIGRSGFRFTDIFGKRVTSLTVSGAFLPAKTQVIIDYEIREQAAYDKLRASKVTDADVAEYSAVVDDCPDEVREYNRMQRELSLR